MARKKKQRGSGDPVRDWLDTLRIKQLKQVAIMKGIEFRLLGEFSVFEVQSWIYDHYATRDNPLRLEEFDKWLEKTLIDEGAITSPIHIDLKLGFYPGAETGEGKRKRRDIQIFGIKKSKAELAAYRPKKGTMKTSVFYLIREGMKTKDIIKKLQKEIPGIKTGSIKVWASQARKQLKIIKELEDE